jgi:hypothetical protein
VTTGQVFLQTDPGTERGKAAFMNQLAGVQQTGIDPLQYVATYREKDGSPY